MFHLHRIKSGLYVDKEPDWNIRLTRTGEFFAKTLKWTLEYYKDGQLIDIVFRGRTNGYKQAKQYLLDNKIYPIVEEKKEHVDKDPRKGIRPNLLRWSVTKTD